MKNSFMIDMSFFDAVIFDMDGVLLDTEEAMMNASIAGFADYGITVCREDFVPFFGTGSVGYFGGVAGKYGLPYSPELAKHMYDKYLEIAGDEVVIYPGVSEKIRQLHQAGFKIAVASSAAGVKVFANLDLAGISTEWVDCVVTEDDITKNKPDPEIFLKAAEGLGVSPAKCLVCEDSFSGVKAAVSAGMKCAGIRGTYDDKELIESGAFVVLNSIVDL